MSSNINSDISQADAHDNDIDGGLDLKSDPASVAAPKTTRADNCWYTAPGLVKQLPPFATVLSTLAQTPMHVYNVHARDAVEGASSGDVMVHGEYRDTPGSTTDMYTSPLWAHNLGQTLNPSQPALPYVARTRQLGAGTSPGAQTSYGVNTFDANANNVLSVTQDLPGADGRRRYAIVTNGFATSPASAGSKIAGITASFGYLDDQGEVIPNANPALLVAGTFTFLQAHALPGTQNWALVTSTGAGGLTCQNYDFAGVAQGATFTFGTGAGISGVGQPCDLFQHNGALYCAYADRASSTASWAYYLINLSTRATPSLLVTGSSAAGQIAGGSAFSATPQNQGAVTTYFGAVFLGVFYVVTVSSAGVPTVAATATLATPTTASSAAGTNQSTGAGVIFDSVGGTGATAVLGFVAYRLFNEQVTCATTGTQVKVDMQSVAIDRFSFAATGNTLTLVATQVFRSPAGVQIAGKAFTTNPGLGRFLGPVSAKTVVCPLRIGSFDIPSYVNGTQAKAPYGQPTYFLVDHQARIVGRWFDGAAPPGQFTGTLPTAAPTGLGQPLIHAPMSDMARVRIQVPSWALIQVQYAPAVNVALTGSFTAPTNTPINPVFVPAVFDMQYQAQGLHVPAIRGGSHQYMSGCMTTLHDGRILTEANFHTAAFNPAADTASYSGNLGPAGTYYYNIVYTWIDALGRKHRSQPSLVAAITIGSGSNFPGAQCIVCAPVGNKAASGNYVTCEVYRSLSNATDGNSYLVGTLAVAPMGTAITPNNATTALVDNTFTDSYTPSGGAPVVGTLSAQPRLYTSINASSVANIYAASAPPPFCWMVATKGRAAGIAYVQGEARLYYSSVDSFGIPLEWNPFNYATIPGEIGEARSVEAIDDKFVILGTRANAVVNGDGPPPSNAAGIPSPGDGFSAVTPLPTPAGVLGTGCPVRIPAGVLYQGMTGITAIGRDLGLTPIGAPVDVLTGRQLGNPGTIYGRATLLPSLQSVVWANTSGPALVLNYMTSAWSTWPLLSNAQSLVQRLNGDIWVGLQPMTPAAIAPASTTAVGADLGALTANTFAFNSPAPTGPALVIETGWIAAGSTQAGQGWLREMALYGGYVGPHVLQIEQGIDYQDYLQAMSWTITTAPINYEYQLRPPSSSVRSMRYRITISPLTTLSAQYQTATLNDLALFSGSKQGTARLSGDASR
jgi:hypothetical protein